MNAKFVMLRVIGVFIGSTVTYYVLEAICRLFMDLDYSMNVYARAVLFGLLMTGIAIWRWYGNDIMAYFNRPKRKKEG